MMRTNRLFWFLALPLCLGASSYALVKIGRPQGPRVETPLVIELGDQEQNKTLRVQLPIRNAGGAALEIRNFHTSCTCLSLFRQSPTGEEMVQDTILQPGEELQAVAEFSMRGSPGEPFRGLVFFDTNDAANPSVRVDFLARIEGRFVSFPAQVDLVGLKPGERRIERLEIRNVSRVHGGRPDRVETDNPEQVVIKSFRRKQTPVDPANRALGISVGEVEIEVRAPRTAGRLTANVNVFEEGNGPSLVEIPVSGTVLPPFQCRPSALMLPRMTGNGPIYSAQILCRATDNHCFRLQVVSAPPNWYVSIPANGTQRSSYFITITCIKPHELSGQQPTTAVVRLKADAGECHEIFEIPVTCRPPTGEKPSPEPSP